MFAEAQDDLVTPADVIFVVTYLPPPPQRGSESYWARPGESATFGRDFDRADIVLFDEVNSPERLTSRTAGELWVAPSGGSTPSGPRNQLWVRNLSRRHPILVHGQNAPITLPPRVGDAEGYACSVPSDSEISAPTAGSWSLQIRPAHPRAHGVVGFGAGSGVAGDDEQQTTDVPRPPEKWLPVVVAMCAPLLQGEHTVASLQQLATGTGLKYATVRDHITRTLAYYREYYNARGQTVPTRPCRPGEPKHQPLAELLVVRGVITRKDLR